MQGRRGRVIEVMFLERGGPLHKGGAFSIGRGLEEVGGDVALNTLWPTQVEQCWRDGAPAPCREVGF